MSAAAQLAQRRASDGRGEGEGGCALLVLVRRMPAHGARSRQRIEGGALPVDACLADVEMSHWDLLLLALRSPDDPSQGAGFDAVGELLRCRRRDSQLSVAIAYKMKRQHRHWDSDDRHGEEGLTVAKTVPPTDDGAAGPRRAGPAAPARLRCAMGCRASHHHHANHGAPACFMDPAKPDQREQRRQSGA